MPSLGRDTEKNRYVVIPRCSLAHCCQQSCYRLWLSASASSRQPEFHAAPPHHSQGYLKLPVQKGHA
ncbi:hypothetical protein Y032_0005g2587 [Ancylostoma ceylanicum]|uniref:Uncharacterized protein n=1 Tax=Ancylostoma ceylanicum TaxID=53326 RepID=A0A016VRX6_9BILA|nr:hypothetical protein Y032_0005g2587 [Ancylostoma ceylanicum]